MKIVVINEDFIMFDNGSQLSSYHDRDCCEQHYADFSALEGQGYENVEFPNGLLDLIVRNKTQKPYYEGGDATKNGTTFFDMIDVEGNKYTIPIYNSNNGYYSTKVDLVLKMNSTYKEIMKIQG